MHSDEPDEPDAQEPTESKADAEAGSGTVALLPKSILAGKTFQVGDEVVLKITALRGDEVEVEYSSEPETPPEDETPPDEGEAEGEPADGAEQPAPEMAPAYGE